MWNPFKRKDFASPVEKKSADFGWPSSWLISGGVGINNQITIKRALRFYDTAAPVATGIDWINDEFKTLPLVVRKGKKVTDDNELLKKLKQPNDDMTQEDFLETSGAHFLITNECYWMATGPVEREAAEIIVISPEFVQVFQGADGFISKMKVSLMGLGVIEFNRAPNEFRFYDSTRTRELWQVKGFSAVSDGVFSNSEFTGSNIIPSRGRSKLSSIHNEINQYIEVARHNLALLDNSLLPSGTLEMPEGVTLTDEQFEDLKEQITEFYTGAKNGGKVMILDNGMKFVPMGIKPKDMNFEKLTETVIVAIFNRYKVPLPLVSKDNMTLANMETAMLNLYDNCVIPMASRLLRELTNFLGPRYGMNPEVEVLSGNLGEVPCMKARHAAYMKAKKELGIYTVNQLLEMDGGVPYTGGDKKGGDLIYIEWTMVPLGTPPVPEQASSSAPDKPLRKTFIQLMQNQFNIEGKRVYSDEQINIMADENRLR